MKTPNEKRFDRRSFIKAGGTGLTGLAFARRLRAQSAARGQDYSGRRVYPLNHRWLYSDRAVPGGTSPGTSALPTPHTVLSCGFCEPSRCGLGPAEVQVVIPVFFMVTLTG